MVTSPPFRSLTVLVEMEKFGDAVMLVVAVVVLTAAVWVLAMDAVLVIEVVPAGTGLLTRTW